MDTPEPTATMQPPAPPPPPPFPTRRLRRRPASGKLGGVCAGIADYVGVDVTVVRLLALLLAVTGPGIPAYIVAWVVMPEAGPDDPEATHASASLGDRGPQLLGTGLLILAVLVVWDGWGWPGDGFLVPIVLIGAGVTLLARSPSDSDAHEPAAPATMPTPRPTTPIDPDVTATMPATAPTVTGPPPPPSTGVEAGAPAPPVEPKRRSAASPIALGIALVWGGLAVLLGVSVETGLAVGLGILGAGIVAGGFLGGGKALILPAAVLTLALIGTAAIDVPVSGGVGERRWEVTEAADATEPFRLAAGEAVLDLRELRPRAEQTIAIEASVALGSLQVELPEGVPVRVDASAGAGQVTILGENEEGTDPELSFEDRGRTGVGTIELDLEVGLGEIEVVR